MLTSKLNENSIGKLGKVLERLLGKGIVILVLDSFQINPMSGITCTGDCIKVERLACDVFKDPLSSYFKTLWNCSL